MFKFWKKIIVSLIIIGPLLYIFFIGYPIKKSAPLPGQSARCFKVGELKEFVECYREGKRLNGFLFMKDLSGRVSSFLPYGGMLFFFFLFTQITLLFLLFL